MPRNLRRRGRHNDCGAPGWAPRRWAPRYGARGRGGRDEQCAGLNARDGDKRSGRGQAKRKRVTRGPARRGGPAPGDRHPGTGGTPGDRHAGNVPKAGAGYGTGRGQATQIRRDGDCGTANRACPWAGGTGTGKLSGTGTGKLRRAPGDRQTARCSSFAIWAECLGVGQKRPAVINWRALRDGVSENSRRFPVASSL